MFCLANKSTCFVCVFLIVLVLLVFVVVCGVQGVMEMSLLVVLWLFYICACALWLSHVIVNVVSNRIFIVTRYVGQPQLALRVCCLMGSGRDEDVVAYLDVVLHMCMCVVAFTCYC